MKINNFVSDKLNSKYLFSIFIPNQTELIEAGVLTGIFKSSWKIQYKVNQAESENNYKNNERSEEIQYDTYTQVVSFAKLRSLSSVTGLATWARGQVGKS